MQTRLKTYPAILNMHCRNPSRPYYLLNFKEVGSVFCLQDCRKTSKKIPHTPFTIDVIESVFRRNNRNKRKKRKNSSLKHAKLTSKIQTRQTEGVGPAYQKFHVFQPKISYILYFMAFRFKCTRNPGNVVAAGTKGSGSDSESAGPTLKIKILLTVLAYS